MKISKAKSILHQHKVATSEMAARRASLVSAEEHVRSLGVEAVRSEARIEEGVAACRDIDETIAELLREVESLRQQRKEEEELITRLRHSLQQEPVELRTARQKVVQAKERIAAQQRTLDRLDKDLGEAQKTMDSFLRNVKLKEDAQKFIDAGVKAKAIEELKQAQAEGKIPADKDVEAIATAFFDKQSKNPSLLREQLVR